MTGIRLICLWLMMLALPLQGLAAASMGHCGARSSAAPSESASAAHHEHAEAMHSHDGHEGHGGGIQADHKCSLCAFCGHAVALNEFPQSPQFGEPAHAPLPEPFVLIPALAVLVPDKPPRA
ncbi:MAG TPA: DUF2946 family protein [Ramlibacter sp.]|nr:DUF2946 family protein [Ramlibacter sp.]